MRFSRQGYWSGLLFPSSGDLPNPGIEPGSSALQADSLPTELQGKPNAFYTMTHLCTCILRNHNIYTVLLVGASILSTSPVLSHFILVTTLCVGWG